MAYNTYIVRLTDFYNRKVLYRTDYGYNALGQLQQLINAKPGANQTLSQFDQMLYDGAGNRLSVRSNLPGVPQLSGTINYAYDLKDQLTSETSGLNGGYSVGFGYDAAGNPTNFKGETRSYDTQNRRTGSGFAYDVQGNPTLYKGVAVSYTPEGEATQFGSLLSADYTSEGVRAWKQAGAIGGGGMRTYFVYDGATPVLELDTSGAVTALNTFGAAGLVSRWTLSGGSGFGGSVFYTFDERGNTSQRTDSSGNVLASVAFDAFGSGLAAPPGSQGSDPFAGFGAQFGYYRDAETGLYLCTFRYYNPVEGRWLTPVITLRFLALKKCGTLQARSERAVAVVTSGSYARTGDSQRSRISRGMFFRPA